MKASQQSSCRTFNYRLNLCASSQEILMIKDEKVNWRLLSILSNMSKNTNDLWKAYRAVAVFEIFYTALRHNYNELHYKSIRKQSLWRYLWCNFKCNWQILKDVSLYFMLKEHDCEKSCENLYTKNSLFA